MAVHSSATVVATLHKAGCDDACDKLVDAYGGRTIEVPKKVSGRLLDVIGKLALSILVRDFGGTRLHVPSRGHGERVSRALALQDDILTSDLSNTEIAARHGVTTRWVSTLRRDLIKKTSFNPRKT